MVKAGVIEPASGPRSYSVVLVKKKDGPLQFCVDYRKLNALTMIHWMGHCYLPWANGNDACRNNWQLLPCMPGRHCSGREGYGRALVAAGRGSAPFAMCGAEDFIRRAPDARKSVRKLFLKIKKKGSNRPREDSIVFNRSFIVNVDPILIWVLRQKERSATLGLWRSLLQAVCVRNYVEEELTKRSSRWQLHGEKHLGPVQPTVNRRIMCRLGKVTGECRRTLQAISNRQAYPGDLERHLQLPDGRSPDVPVKTLAKVRQQFYWH
ncbi:hypothetical protein T05_6282 [Trichinella murrelli]|uniref:Transposon Ty3-I Gag-Pol polyprotein n=1 Tax=Trichinella murrelli TaxID=144512 RepID=A0A0V0UIG3_9BILA|nr:hypothetical protein T05_6282 [Trichinella murrelli]